MEASKKILHQFLEGSDKRFVIPVYQRNYNWKTDNCKRLLDDLIRVSASNVSSHFFGGIVYYRPNVANVIEHQIIDGQQRLTTVTIFLLALADLIEGGKIKSEDSRLVERIRDYIVDKYAPENAKVKLKPINEDEESFRRLFEKNQDLIEGSNVTRNYRFFLDAIAASGLSADLLYKAFQKFEFVDIAVEKSDKPQLIFESINSTGVSLSEGDKIRNFVLMDLESTQQETYFKAYWKPIETLVSRGGDSDGVGMFVRDFLSMENSTIPNLGAVYAEFKLYNSNFPDREDLLKRLLSAAKSYNLIIHPENAADLDLRFALVQLKRLNCQPANPFTLKVLQMLEASEITMAQAVSVLSIAESYVLRRLICDLPTNALNKVFADLHKSAMVNTNGADIPYEQKIAYALRIKTGAAEFPDDNEFSAGLKVKNVYEMRSSNRAYFLARLENGTSMSAPVCGAEDAVYSKILHGVLTVEHVMPQTLTAEWRSELGADSERVHSEWLHRLGNLTLTAYNSEMSNKSFSSKSGRSLDELKQDNFGFASEGNHISLNSFIATCTIWNEGVMEDRTNILAERAKMIWKYPHTTYIPPAPPEFPYRLSEHKAGFFTGSKPIAILFKGDRYSVDTWVSLARQTVKLLQKEDEEKLRQSAKMSSTKLLAAEENEYTEKVCDNVHAVFTGSTFDRCHMLKAAFKAFAPLDIEFVFSKEIFDDEESDSDTDQEDDI